MHISPKSALYFRPTLVAIALLAIAEPATLNRACAQTAKQAELPVTNNNLNNPQPLNAQFQYGILTATTNTINATLVPITTTSGALIYEDLTIPFSVSEDSAGKIQVVAGTITAVPSPMPETGAFLAGNYVGPGGGTAQLLTLSGPGATSNGATMWSSTTTAGATGCTYPYSSSFYVGPLQDNPLYSRLQTAGITSTAYSYGIEGQQMCSTGNPWFDSGSILGFSQTGDLLTIVSFTYEGEDDQSTPGDQITYMLIQP